jgi:hypothetical protein
VELFRSTKMQSQIPRSPIIQPTFAGHHGVEAEAPLEIVGKLLWPSVEFPLVSAGRTTGTRHAQILPSSAEIGRGSPRRKPTPYGWSFVASPPIASRASAALSLPRFMSLAATRLMALHTLGSRKIA